MSRTSKSDGRWLAGLVASYVRANPHAEEWRAHLGELHDYARRSGLPDLPREELDRAVQRHWSALEGAAEKVRREAALFNADRTPRPVRYRHGSGFCPACWIYKDYRKECPSCGHLELTL